MAKWKTKVELYAKSKGVNSVNFLDDVVLALPISKKNKEDVFISVWNLDIEKPTMQKLNEFEAEANTLDANTIDKKASGKQKLKDLGLDDAEIKALIGV
jgi:hypothetical protein